MKFDPEKSLFDLPAVRWTVALSVFFSIASSVAIFVHSDLYLKLDYNGFNSGVDVFKVPLGMLAVGLSLVGIYGANHRSEQTRRQIERTAQQIDLTTSQIAITRLQNNFSNYYKHLEEFTKFCDKHEKDGYSVKSSRRLHSKIYPSAADGIITVNPEFVEHLISCTRTFMQFILNLGPKSERGYAARDIVHQERTLIEFFSLTSKVRTGTNWNIDGENIFIASGNLQAFVQHHLNLFRLIDEVLSFDTTYQTPASLRQIVEFKGENIPTANFYHMDSFVMQDYI